MVDEVLAGRAVPLDGAGRRDVVRGDAVAQNGERAGQRDVGKRRRLFWHIIKIGWVGNIGRRKIPLIGLSLLDFDLLPLFRPFEDIRIAFAKHLR